MAYSSTEPGKRPCAYVLDVGEPLQSISGIWRFLVERKISVDLFQVLVLENGEGRVIIHCQVENDRIRHTASLLEKMPGVINLHWMLAKGAFPL